MTAIHEISHQLVLTVNSHQYDCKEKSRKANSSRQCFVFFFSMNSIDFLSTFIEGKQSSVWLPASTFFFLNPSFFDWECYRWSRLRSAFQFLVIFFFKFNGLVWLGDRPSGIDRSRPSGRSNVSLSLSLSRIHWKEKKRAHPKPARFTLAIDFRGLIDFYREIAEENLSLWSSTMAARRPVRDEETQRERKSEEKERKERKEERKKERNGSAEQVRHENLSACRVVPATSTEQIQKERQQKPNKKEKRIKKKRQKKPNGKQLDGERKKKFF